GAFVLDISAIKANADFSFSYSSTDATGKVLDSSTGTIKRSVNIVDVFSGGSVTANPNNTTNSVANTMSKVAVDIFNDYKLPITLVGQKTKTVNWKEIKHSFFSSSTLFIKYEEGIELQKVQFALPSQLKSYGDGDFEVELKIYGTVEQTYKRSVSANSNQVEIELDPNAEKLLGGKSYNIKVYKRISPTITELVMNSTNSIPDKTYQETKEAFGSKKPAAYYYNIGDVLRIGEQVVDHQGVLKPYNNLKISNVPVGTSRVEVKYKPQGSSQWSTLTTSATLYNNIPGWYQVNLSALAKNRNYDYQYITYNAKGDILGGGQGVINTANNQASAIQKALSIGDMPSVYNDKKEVVNNKQDVVKGFFVESSTNAVSVSTNGAEYSPVVENYPIKLKYNFNNDILKKYGNNFVLIFENYKDGYIKTSEQFSINSDVGTTSFALDLSVDELHKLKSYTEPFNGGNLYYFDVKLVLVEDNKFINIGEMRQSIGVTIVNNPQTPWGQWGIPTRIVGVPPNNYMFLEKKSLIRLTNQTADTHMVMFYYRELGSNGAYKTTSSMSFLKDIYGQEISGNFELELSNIDPAKKYEFQYISFNKDYIVINRQQGVLEQNFQGVNVSVTPLNYGGNGFIIYRPETVEFVDQFGLKVGDTSNVVLKVRKVGATSWDTANAYYGMADDGRGGTTFVKNYLIWDYRSFNSNYDLELLKGDYEFKLEVFDQSNNIVPKQGIIGKILLSDTIEPKVLSYIPTSFVQNHITFSGQPTGSKTLTVKYGTVAGQLNQTAVLNVGADGKAILDATAIAELNLFGSTTVYYSYETIDANNKLVNRATGYINVGLGAGSGEHKNELNDSWIDLQPAQNNGIRMEVSYRKRQVDANGNFVSDLINADINSDAYWGDKAQFETVTLTPQNGVYRWNINNLVPNDG
ncbi:hypothetical protein, partial [Acinetobacter sp. 3657]|uniref:hypothetical protein n=1 Tax=Acinetobacter sp. 3657 TaxID=2817764 RepID=UPI00285D22CE|nr:hypothetical protein [Prolinoborus sp. 3657]